MPLPENISTNDYNIAYWHLRPFYTLVIDLLEPLPDRSLGAFLNKYPKENPDEYRARLSRIAQVNFVDLVIDAYAAMLHSTDIQITAKKFKNEVEEFINDCNMQGDSLVDYFREQVTPQSLAYGNIDVFCDKPSVAGDLLTLADEELAGVNKPYCYIVPPVNRLAWRLDDAKQYVEYRSQDFLNTQVSTAMQIRDDKQYIQWTTDSVSFYDDEGRLQAEKTRPNPYGRIPAVTIIPKPSKRYHDDRIGVSLVQDIAPLQKIVINIISLLLDWQINANYIQRVIIQDTDQGDEPPTEGELAEGGTAKGVILRGKGTKYEIPSPNPSGNESMRAFLCEVIEWIYRSVHMADDSGQNKTHQTGATIRANRNELYTALNRISKHLAKSMKQVVEMALRVRGIDPVEAGVTVQWATNFSFDAAINSIEELTQLRAAVQDISPTMVTEYAKKTVIPHMFDSAKIEQVLKELDAWKGPQPSAPAGGDEGEPTLQQENVSISAAERVEESE